MKLKISLDVELDPVAWTETYGVEGSAAIQDDVRAYILNHVNRSAAADECALFAQRARARRRVEG